MSLYEENKIIMNKYNIAPQKKYGQNFLIDESVLDKIILNADIKKGDLVIEIGPGLGNLTRRLCEKAGRVIAIEIDENMVSILSKEYSYLENLTIINQDIMKTNLNEVISKFEDVDNVKVVANLPYYITTPIIMKLLEERLNIKSITVMVQKEVAERLAEKPGGKESGAITYSIAYYTDAKIVLNVGRECFVPSPEVDSAVIKLDLLKEPRVKVSDEKLFFKVVKASFMLKRKTLVNGLVNGKIFNSKQEAEECLNKLGIDLKIRGEKLTLEQFAEISEYVKSIR